MSEDFFWFGFEEIAGGHYVKHEETWQFLQVDGTLGDTKTPFSDIKVFPWISMILQAEGEEGAVNVGIKWTQFIPHKDVANWITICRERLEKGVNG